MAAITPSHPLYNSLGLTGSETVTFTINAGRRKSTFKIPELTEAAFTYTLDKLVGLVKKHDLVNDVSIELDVLEKGKILQHRVIVDKGQLLKSDWGKDVLKSTAKAVTNTFDKTTAKPSQSSPPSRHKLERSPRQELRVHQKKLAAVGGKTISDLRQTAAEVELFSSTKASDIKHALNELYSAESVFLGKLKILRNEPEFKSKDVSLTEKKMLGELIKSTETILASLTTFEQIGAKQSAELRTLEQDFGHSIRFEANKPGENRDLLQQISLLRNEVGELSGKLQYASSAQGKETLTAQVSNKMKELSQSIEKLRNSENPQLSAIAEKFDRIAQLKQEIGQLAKVPEGGILHNLTSVLNKTTIKKQYDLLTYFSNKAQTMKAGGDKRFTSYQEIVNKITRYPMLIDAILNHLPEKMRQSGQNDVTMLVELKKTLLEQASRSNTAIVT